MYVDESGKIKPKVGKFYGIAGVIIHELDIQDIGEEVKKYKLANFGKHDIEIHTYHMWNGEGDFKIFHISERKIHLRNLYKAINLFPITIIGVIIDKVKMNSPRFIDWSVLKAAWTFMVERFDMFLQDNGEKGMIIIDQSTREPDSEIRNIITKIQKNGSNVHTVKHILEQPLFLDSRESIGLQIADSIAYCLVKNFNGSNFEDFYETYVLSKYRRNINTDEIIGYGLKVFPN